MAGCQSGCGLDGTRSRRKRVKWFLGAMGAPLVKTNWLSIFRCPMAVRNIQSMSNYLSSIETRLIKAFEAKLAPVANMTVKSSTIAKRSSIMRNYADMYSSLI